MLHTKTLHGNPLDGHTLGPVITELKRLTGVDTRRIHVDKGYRGHNHEREAPGLDHWSNAPSHQTDPA